MINTKLPDSSFSLLTTTTFGSDSELNEPVAFLISTNSHFSGMLTSFTSYAGAGVPFFHLISGVVYVAPAVSVTGYSIVPSVKPFIVITTLNSSSVLTSVSISFLWKYLRSLKGVS